MGRIKNIDRLGERTSVIIFWLFVIFHLDPGGLLHSHFEPIEITIFYIFSFTIVAVIYGYNYRMIKYNVLKLKYVRYYISILIVWYIYYFGVYFGVNNKEYSGVLRSFLRNFQLLYTSFLVIPIVFFSSFSLKIFFRLLIWSTIFIGLAFIITVLAGIPLINTWSGIRQAGGNLSRTFMYGYGLINFVIPLTVSAIFLRLKVNKKIVLSFFISLSIIVITLFRRDMVGLIEYTVIASLLTNYIQGNKMFRSIAKYLNLRNILFLSFIFLMMNLVSPNVLSKTSQLVEDTIVDLGLIEGKNRRVNDVRLSLTDKTGIITALSDNILIGTGFNPVWFTGDGGEKGWEGADYVFLSSFAMYGVIGLVIFLPFYILVIVVTVSLLKIIKNHYKFLMSKKNTILFIVVGISSITEFIKNIIEYPNWFYPIGAIQDRGKFYIFLGLLIGCYYGIQLSLQNKGQICER